mgnify:CR=1 FL=1
MFQLKIRNICVKTTVCTEECSIAGQRTRRKLAVDYLLLQRTLGGGLAVLDGALKFVHLLVELRQLAAHRHVKLIQEISNFQDVYLHNLCENRINM